MSISTATTAADASAVQPASVSASPTVPAGYHTINPYVTVRDIPAMVQFLQRTFDGVQIEAIRQPDGAIAHTEVRIGDTVLMLGPPEVDAPMPARAEPRPGTFYVYVADVDATYHRAMACGASSWELPSDRFYGDRVASVVDTNRNVWWIATRQRTYSKDELQALAERRWSNGEPTV